MSKQEFMDEFLGICNKCKTKMIPIDDTKELKELKKKDVYHFYCPNCKTNHRQIFNSRIAQNEIDRMVFGNILKEA